MNNNIENKKRQYPLLAEEAFFTREEALFPREVLEPLFERYIRENPPCDMSRHHAQGFFKFLLTQSKPTNLHIEENNTVSNQNISNAENYWVNK